MCVSALKNFLFRNDRRNSFLREPNWLRWIKNHKRWKTPVTDSANKLLAQSIEIYRQEVSSTCSLIFEVQGCTANKILKLLSSNQHNLDTLCERYDNIRNYNIQLIFVFLGLVIFHSVSLSNFLSWAFSCHSTRPELRRRFKFYSQILLRSSTFIKDEIY